MAWNISCRPGNTNKKARCVSELESQPDCVQLWRWLICFPLCKWMCTQVRASRIGGMEMWTSARSLSCALIWWSDFHRQNSTCRKSQVLSAFQNQSIKYNYFVLYSTTFLAGGVGGWKQRWYWYCRLAGAVLRAWKNLSAKCVVALDHHPDSTLDKEGWAISET